MRGLLCACAKTMLSTTPELAIAVAAATLRCPICPTHCRASAWMPGTGSARMRRDRGRRGAQTCYSLKARPPPHAGKCRTRDEGTAQDGHDVVVDERLQRCAAVVATHVALRTARCARHEADAAKAGDHAAQRSAANLDCVHEGISGLLIGRDIHVNLLADGARERCGLEPPRAGHVARHSPARAPPQRSVKASPLRALILARPPADATPSSEG